MNEQARRRVSIGTSIGLVVLTLGVFGFSQNIGPESCVRRFHDAVRRRAWGEVQSELLQDLQSYGPIALTEGVADLMTRGLQPRVRRTIRDAEGVTVVVSYVDSDGVSRQDLNYMLVATRGGWRIDADMTLIRFRRSLGVY